MNRHKKNIMSLIGLAVIFIFPMIISTVLYHSHRHFKTTNHGVLVNPVVPVGNLLSLKSKNRKWQLVYLPGKCCDTQCLKIMFDLHQIHIALGKDLPRVDLRILQTKTCPIQQNDFLPSLLSPQQKIQLQATLTRGSNQFIVDNKVYLIDPVGNLMMYYPATVSFLDVLKDLKHVLGVSQIG